MKVDFIELEDNVKVEDPMSYMRVNYYEEEFADAIIDYHKKLNKENHGKDISKT